MFMAQFTKGQYSSWSQKSCKLEAKNLFFFGNNETVLSQFSLLYWVIGLEDFCFNNELFHCKLTELVVLDNRDSKHGATG